MNKSPLILFTIIIMITIIIGIFISFKVDESPSLKGNEITYECYKLKEGLNLSRKGLWNNGEGIQFPRDFYIVDCKEAGEKENCTKTEKNYCATECYENDKLIPCENFTYDEHFCNEGICEASGGCPDYYEKLEGKTVSDCVKEVEKFASWDATEYLAERFPPLVFVNYTGKENG